MGAAVSKNFSSIDILNESLTTVIMDSSINCSVQQSSNQDLSFNDLKFKYCDVNIKDINQSTKLSTNVTCAQDINQNSLLQNKFLNELNQKLESKVKDVSISPGLSITESVNNFKNVVRNNISITNIANCVANTISSQKLAFEKLEFECYRGQKINISNVQQSIVSNIISKCTQSVQSVVVAAADLDNKVKQNNTSTTQGMNPALSGMSMSSSLMFSFIVFFILILVVADE